jgi:nicotinamidase/pyrazinamidase
MEAAGLYVAAHGRASHPWLCHVSARESPARSGAAHNAEDDVPKIPLTRKDALIVVDVQKDFLPGGSLAVPRGDEVIPPLNACIERFHRERLPVYATSDWHPPDHGSFREQDGPWPPHCIAGTAGADFAEGLALPSDTRIISKGLAPDEPGYSAFAGTGLLERLRMEGVERLYLGGLATEYCVLNTALDALKAGFGLWVLEDAVRAVDASDGERALATMQQAGARLITSDRITL